MHLSKCLATFLSWSYRWWARNVRNILKGIGNVWHPVKKIDRLEMETAYVIDSQSFGPRIVSESLCIVFSAWRKILEQRKSTSMSRDRPVRYSILTLRVKWPINFHFILVKISKASRQKSEIEIFDANLRFAQPFWPNLNGKIIAHSTGKGYIFNFTILKSSEYDNVHNLELTISRAISTDIKESQ